ncbi:alpha/beta hydrolase [Paenibacillus sp. N1-5-1-14]|uniref:alpha/beta hydrolase n=1 Tax=Paenibacillus radicibacter TaxID=2972488 RepID=UPI0021599C7D|nr:alpha/beta hydrolase [Paenibacillus radicibacter]MCR8641865.1 alpha/beta hydrolase [Paenibacillus radicibacter]
MYWIIGVIGLVVVACIVPAIWVGLKLTHPIRKVVTNLPSDYGLAYSEVTFPSQEGDVLLSGWHMEASENRQELTVVFAHGYSGNRLEEGLPILSLAQSIISQGYDVLMFDFRNSGESGGKMTTVGYMEKQDLLGAIQWASRKAPHHRIVLVGYSMGAMTSLLAAAEDKRVAGVIADSPFSQLRSYLSANLSYWSGLPKFPFTWLIMVILPLITGIKEKQVDGIKAVNRIFPRPILFVHSDGDEAIPSSESEKLWQTHPNTFEFWRTQDAPHVGTYRLQPVEYTNKMLKFLRNL